MNANVDPSTLTFDFIPSPKSSVFAFFDECTSRKVIDRIAAPWKLGFEVEIDDLFLTYAYWSGDLAVEEFAFRQAIRLLFKTQPEVRFSEKTGRYREVFILPDLINARQCVTNYMKREELVTSGRRRLL